MRRSTRLAAARCAPTPAVFHEARASTPSKHEGKQAVCSPPRKRREVEAGEGGSLASPSERESISLLQQLPLDVLFEAFRNTLMSRSTRGLWKKSYAATAHELPPIPEDVTIPHFVSFIVDNVCDFCHASDLKDREIRRTWAVRVRCCETCIHDGNHVLHGEDALRELKIIRDIHRYFGRNYRLDQLFPTFSPVRHHDFDKWYPRAPIESLAADFERDNKRNPVVIRKRWLEQRASEHVRIQKYASICEEWEEQTLCRKIERDRKVQRERLDEILRRLSALGWADEVQHSGSWHSLSMHPFAAKAEPLTEEDWRQNREQLIQFTQGLRDRRLAVERGKTIERRYRELDAVYKVYLASKTRREKWELPGIGDLVSWQEVRDFIEGALVEEEITSGAMRALIDRLAESKFEEWRTSCEEALIQMLNAEDTARKRSATKDDLRLAATVFCEKHNCGVACYPEALHRLRPGYFGSASVEQDPHVIVHQYAWSAADVCVKKRTLRAAERVVRRAGLNPRTATPRDMDARDPWFMWRSDVPKAGEVPDYKKEVWVLPWRRTLSETADGKDFVLLSESQMVPILELRARTYWDGGYMKWSQLNAKGNLRKKRA
ncbi:uncharacterized protein SCHCODRAFT_02483153 [Schizophyllum commune H4-8]|nr:uncharacterized protein SCHCODRAFT_02483153 [Schizophyllum commune H4-8]KAI5900838.1 hypothetical protein SCHCODRAFT_02483153 [Schizophyllum commune H4-8]